ncbi:MAG: glycoside hydrolase family 108 protein [Paracoccaceae bacterium]
MKDNFPFCLKEVLKHEGGWADHPSDPGGATMKGITIGTYRQWKGRSVTKAELRAISDEEVAAIYKRNYWDKVRGDDLPSGLDFVAFDPAVNSGPSRGAKWLQSALGVTADGKIGPKTLAEAKDADAATAIKAACNARMSFLRSLKTWPTFGKGWSRRVADVQAKALALAKARPSPLDFTRAPETHEKLVVDFATPPKSPAQRVSASAPPSGAKRGSGLAAALVGGLLVAVGAVVAKFNEALLWVQSWFN